MHRLEFNDASDLLNGHRELLNGLREVWITTYKRDLGPFSNSFSLCDLGIQIIYKSSGGDCEQMECLSDEQ